MPRQQQFFEDMQAEGRQAALLIAQVGAMPSELQLIVQIAQHEEAEGGLRPIRTYIVRVLGVLEHRIMNLGTTTDEVLLTADHPVLFPYSTPSSALFFKGQADDVPTTVLDIAQEHALTFQGWRHFPDFLNVDAPLMTLLASGGGLLGQMPLPLALRLERALQAHGLETKLLQGEIPAKPPVAGQTLQVFVLGDSYFVSHAFSFEEMRRSGT